MSTVRPSRRKTLSAGCAAHLTRPLLPFLMQHQFDHCPTRHLKRAALILVAVNIEPGLVFSSNPVFADVLPALDLHDRAQRQKRGTGYRLASAANVRS